MGRLLIILATVLVATLQVLSLDAKAETLTIGLSKEELLIASNFTGDTVTVFGTIKRDRATVPRVGPYDFIVAVRGPPDGIVAREKTRVAGIWINTQSRTFYLAPTYYAVLSTRPLDEIASPEIRERLGLGLREGMQKAATVVDEKTGTFLDAVVRKQLENARFFEVPDGVRMLDDTFFQATIPIPSTVPVGVFSAEVHLFSGGVPLAQTSTEFIVDKTGFEQLVFVFANEHPLIYGVLAVILAVATGWLGGVVFRRD